MSKPNRNQGSLTLIALLILVGLAVLGSAMGWMQLRGIDITTEWLNKPTFAQRSLDKLLELGRRVAQNQLHEQCSLPAAPDYQLNLPGWGSIAGTFLPPTTDGQFPFLLTGTQGNNSQQMACRAVCSPCYGALCQTSTTLLIRIACP
ncbi:MAG: hypothetical protein HQL87_16960 [Magnetococcales bacterium]|nr:hypothetical protein [Magnetococcales bacterium]